jgi:hypothetical protein
MSDLDTEQRLERLRMAFPSDEALADTLSCSPHTISDVSSKDANLNKYPDLSAKIDRLHEQIQKEHAAGLDAVHYALQTIQRLREGSLTDEHLENVESVLQEKADTLNSTYA